LIIIIFIGNQSNFIKSIGTPEHTESIQKETKKEKNKEKQELTHAKTQPQ
jgi:hypothetical protein